ncbi:Glutamate carboxypeptidase 2 [Portunus trituberculatus]|uniref:Glutamate carboxypeptidase 2 n=1 Tax=Portunus trituberculatus TaxID=210409 RepID=A0A5B7EG45_PORTR|nr:Glutamate carboxypeptidase 2 [Portunus trituberculatus]
MGKKRDREYKESGDRGDPHASDAAMETVKKPKKHKHKKSSKKEEVERIINVEDVEDMDISVDDVEDSPSQTLKLKIKISDSSPDKMNTPKGVKVKPDKNKSSSNSKKSSKKKDGKGEDDTDSEEERWLDAIESGKLEEVDDELKRMKNPRLMTARQRAMMEKEKKSDGTDDTFPVIPAEPLLSLPSVTLSDPEPPSGHAYYRQHIIDNINTNNINASLRFFTLEPHPAGSPVDEHLAQYIHTTWGMHGLKTHLIKYELFLATANADMPNKVILNGTDGEVFESSPVQPAVDVPSAGQQEIYSFNSFCGVGVAQQSSSVVYANYGRDKDFHFLSENNVTVNNSIVFIRYGKLFRGDKVRFAESRGAAAVVLYTDPADAAPLGPLDTYPSTVFAPPGATQLGSLKLQGDLLTPGYPAVESAFRLPESEADLFSIPVQPMGYGDAWHFLSLLEGKEAPPTWQGDLNLTYHLGPQLAGGAQVTVVVNDQHHRKTVYNVLGIIEGQEEPGNYSFGAMAVPMLHDVIFEMAKLVPNPDPDEVAEGRDSLYDTWLHRYPSQSSGDSAPLPTVAPLGTGSDFRAFLFNLGIPSMDLVFTSAPPILPYNVATYTNFISASWGELCLSHGPQLAHFNVSTEALEAALEELVSAGKAFQERRSYFTNAE